MRKRKKYVFYIFLMIIATTCSAVAGAQIELRESQVELVSDVDDFTYLRSMPETMSYQGHYQINLTGIGEKSQLEIKFKATDPKVYVLMANQIQIQYCLQAVEQEGQWSEWISLNRLPLVIPLRDWGLHSLTELHEIQHSPNEIVVLLRFRVSHSIQLRHGVFEGEFILQLH